ncbi:MAG TPA: HypC/HybG/HupF family hydrogenase formation chaperone [Azospirillum sp.]|nr:HypC/HybG/HupF family hydrogenase formation chaperone [Azospirillum sp.]
MCIGIPMLVDRVDGFTAECSADGQRHAVDIALVQDAAPGDWVLVFLGAARHRLDPEEARLIREALSALAAAMNGQVDDSAFADLIGREPELPAHLREARAAGRMEA